MQNTFDVLIVGGGLVGCSAAIALRELGFEVALVDREGIGAEPLAKSDNASWDARIYAISPGNKEWLATLGVWPLLNANRVCPVSTMHVFGDQAGHLSFKTDGLTSEALSYIVESDHLLQACGRRLDALQIPQFVAEPRTFHLTAQAVELGLSDGQRLSASLVIGADGAHSWVRSQAGMTCNHKPYQQVGVVANFAIEREHHQTAKQWFLPDSILAWLPLSGKAMSMVWSTTEAHAKHLMSLSANALAKEVGQAGGYDWGELQVLQSAQAFPLALQHVSSLIAERVVLVGDAGHLVHPLAGQGVNLGFRDVAELSQVLAACKSYEDCGSRMILRQYERARKVDILSMTAVTHGLNGLFKAPQSFAQTLRNQGLNLVERMPFLKNQLIRQAMR